MTAQIKTNPPSLSIPEPMLRQNDRNGVIDIGHEVIDIGHEVINIGHEVIDLGHGVIDIGHGVIDIGHEVFDKFPLRWRRCLRRVVFLKNCVFLK